MVAALLSTQSTECSSLAVRLSATTLWADWGLSANDFYFQTYTWEEFMKGPDYTRVRHHTSAPDFELWLNSGKFGKFTNAFAFRYQHNRISLADSIDFSYERYQKTLNLELNWFSLGQRVILETPVRIYGGWDLGYCRGYLETHHSYEVPDGWLSSFNVTDHGGGPFMSVELGLDLRIHKTVSLFSEVGYVYTHWDPFKIEHVVGIWNPHENYLFDHGRNINITNFKVSLGVEINTRF